MIDANDTKTTDIFPVKRGRGRPSTGSALSDAERARAYRLRKKENKPEGQEFKATELLARFITELGDNKSITPSEEWVNQVKQLFLKKYIVTHHNI